MFIRKNTVFTDNFSIGLNYKDANGNEFSLYRINGKQLKSHISHHRQIHSHQLEETDIQNSKNNKPSEITELSFLKNFNEALEYFCKFTNITNYRNILGGINEPSLFDND